MILPLALICPQDTPEVNPSERGSDWLPPAIAGGTFVCHFQKKQEVKIADLGASPNLMFKIFVIGITLLHYGVSLTMR
jgi:hypothetical protein